MRVERRASGPSNKCLSAASAYRATCILLTGAIAFAACAIDPSGDVASSRATLPEIPPDAFTGAIVPTEGATGWTQGRGAVTEDGAAVFDVPLFIPPGRNGIQPELALHYHSRQGDALLGTGWSLSGLSMITRCARNELIDGVTRNVEFSARDAFCLDGDRLVEAPSEGFWGGGQYRRWRDGFERITLENGQPGDPNSIFKVWRPDGTIWTYGATTDGYIRGPRVAPDPATGDPLPAQNQTYGWLLTRTEDRFGNYAEYHYEPVAHGDQTVEVVPTTIDYTGHPTLGPGRRHVTFQYEARPTDAASVVQWISGFGLRVTKAISRIVMSAPGEPSTVREYRLGHHVSSVDSAYMLGMIEECDGAGTCREPLLFHYNEPYLGLIQESADTRIQPSYDADRPDGAHVITTTSAIGPSQSQFSSQSALLSQHVGDWAPAPGTWQIIRESPTTASHGSLWEASAAGTFWNERIGIDATWHIIPTDYNRDGDLELLQYRAAPDASGAFHTYLELVDLTYDDSSALTPDMPRWPTSVLHTYGDCVDASNMATMLADVDGNGVEDLIFGCTHGERDFWKVQLHDRGDYGSYSAPNPFPVNARVADPRVFVVDWDGNGRQDLVSQDAESHTFIAYGMDDSGGLIEQLTNIPTEEPDGHGWDYPGSTILLDANGDGLADVLTLDGREWDNGLRFNVPVLRINMGGVLGPAIDAVPTADADYWMWRQFAKPERTSSQSFRVADLNADGRDDFIMIFSVGWTGEAGPRCERYTDGPCLESSRESGLMEATNYMVGYVSAGESFRSVRIGIAGPPSYRLDESTPVWADTQVLDLGGDGMPDFVYTRNGDCSGPSSSCYLAADGNYYYSEPTFHVRPGPYRSATGLMTYAYSGVHVARFEYGHVSQPDGTCQYPLRCAAEGVHVVRKFVDALQRTQRHWYRGPRADLRAGVSLGFSRHYVVDETTGAVTETRFDNKTDVPGAGIAYAGLVDERITYAPITNTQGPGFRVFYEDFDYRVTSLSTRHHAVQLRTHTQRTYETATIAGGCTPVATQLGCDSGCRECADITTPTSGLLTEHTTTLGYDARGSLRSLRETSPGLREDATSITVEDRPADWLVGLPRRIEVTSSAYSGAVFMGSAKRVSEHAFDSRGFRTQTKVEPDDPRATVVIDYVPDAFGHVATSTESATGLDPRTTTFYYDPEEMLLPRAVENAEGHVEMIAVHPGLGVPVLTIDANGVETRAKYDGFGRLRSSYRQGAEAAETTVSYSDLWGCATGPHCMTIASVAPGHSSTARDVDPLGRVLTERERLPDGWVSREIAYDAVGRVHEMIGPRRSGDTSYLHQTIDYDALSRPVRMRFYDGNPDITFTYDGLVATQVDRRGRPSRVTADALGRQSQRTVYDGTTPITVSQTFGPFGTLVEVEQGSAVTWSQDYDAYGRVLSAYDPDSGPRSYEYNPFGELTREYSASGRLFTEVTKRDRLGRIHESWNEEDGTTTFDWDSALHGVGALGSTYTSDGVKTTYTYDMFARPEETQQTIGAGPTFASYVKYDDYGRVRERWYPYTGRAPQFAIRYRYDSAATTGRPQGVDAWTGSAWSSLWEPRGYDPLGRITRASLGNGREETSEFDPITARLRSRTVSGSVLSQQYYYDASGNLSSRVDDRVGTERFFYDDLNRLQTWHSPAGPVSYDYDALGNLVLNGGVVQRFGERGAGPHQLTTAGARSAFAYDDRGRRTTDGLWTITKYRSSGLPGELWSSTGGTVRLTYDALGQRARRTSTSEERTYLGQLYERVVVSGKASHVFRIYAEGQPLAEVQEDSTGARKTYYLHQDGLGSIVAITDSTGALAQRFQYEPFGGRRPLLSSSLPSTRGFTFHEHETDTGWINMRGRIYDPTNGTFLTPDPFVRSTLSGDALNPYEYVEGNPLTFTDPTGFQRDELTDWGVEDFIEAGFSVLAGALFGASSGSGGAGGGGNVGYTTGQSAPAPQHRTAPPAIADTMGSSAGDTANSGAGVHQNVLPSVGRGIVGGELQGIAATVAWSLWTASPAGFTIWGLSALMSDDIDAPTTMASDFTQHAVEEAMPIPGQTPEHRAVESWVSTGTSVLTTLALGTMAEGASVVGGGGRLVALDANAFRNLSTLRSSGILLADDRLMISPNVAGELARHGISGADVVRAGVWVANESPIGASVAATRIGDVLRGLGGRGAASASADALNLAEATGLGAEVFITADRQILRAFGGESIMPGTGGEILRVLGF